MLHRYLTQSHLRLKLFFIFPLLLSNSGFCKEMSPLTHNVISCSIYDMHGKKIWSFNGNICLFFPDGSFAVSSWDTLRFYSKNMKLLWEKSISAHHQINLANNGKEFLVMSETYKTYKGKLVRFDHLFVINLKGEILKEFSFYKNRKEIQRLAGRQPSTIAAIPKKNRRNQKVTHEFSHANSFYQIPENQLEKKNHTFNAGNYIVNINLQSVVLILDNNLDKIIWSLPHNFNKTRDFNLHDVQIQRDGTLLVYANRGERDFFSTIDEIHPLSLKVKPLYKETPPEKFFAEMSGGVQRLDAQRILINIRTEAPKAIEIDVSKSKPKIVWSMVRNKKPRKAFQQIKRFDLSDFLKNNQRL